MTNCKYCGQFISHRGEGIESNDVIGFLEIQETEYYHTKCKYKYYALKLIENTDKGIAMSSRDIAEQWGLTKNEVGQIIILAFELSKRTPCKK